MTSRLAAHETQELRLVALGADFFFPYNLSNIFQSNTSVANVNSDGSAAIFAVIRSDRRTSHHAFNVLCVVRQRRDPFADQAARGGRVLSQQNGSQRVRELVRRTDLADLADLLNEFTVLHRVERILVLHLRDQQPEELVNIDIVQAWSLLVTSVRRLVNRRSGWNS